MSYIVPAVFANVSAKILSFARLLLLLLLLNLASGSSGKNQAGTETLTTRGGVVHMNFSLDWQSQVLLHPPSEALLKKTTANRK
jgi:hypothetical protein